MFLYGFYFLPIISKVETGAKTHLKPATSLPYNEYFYVFVCTFVQLFSYIYTMAKAKTVKYNSVGANPFVPALVINVTEHISDKTYYMTEVDRSVKVFKTIQSRESVNSLSPMGAKFFNFLLFRLESGCDIVTLKSADFMDYAGVKSSRTFYTCVNELGNARIIAQVIGKKSMYWINPAVCFFGSRIDAYPANVFCKHINDRTTKKG